MLCVRDTQRLGMKSARADRGLAKILAHFPVRLHSTGRETNTNVRFCEVHRRQWPNGYLPNRNKTTALVNTANCFFCRTPLHTGLKRMIRSLSRVMMTSYLEFMHTHRCDFLLYLDASVHGMLLRLCTCTVKTLLYVTLAMILKKSLTPFRRYVCWTTLSVLHKYGTCP